MCSKWWYQLCFNGFDSLHLTDCYKWPSEPSFLYTSKKEIKKFPHSQSKKRSHWSIVSCTREKKTVAQTKTIEFTIFFHQRSHQFFPIGNRTWISIVESMIEKCERKHRAKSNTQKPLQIDERNTEQKGTTKSIHIAYNFLLRQTKMRILACKFHCWWA